MQKVIAVIGAKHMTVSGNKFAWVGLGAFALMLIGALTLRSWLVDDAAISFAYARNLARYGVLAPQPGAMPVEGFSNPLWVAIIAPFAGACELVVVLKTLAVGMMAWVCFRMASAFRKEGLIEANIALLLLACQPAVVIWSFSGLENPLYLAAGLELLVRVCRAASGRASVKDACAAGFASACLALTRPEGIIYAPLFVMAALLSGNRQGVLKKAAFSMGIPVCVAAAYLIFRLCYFGSWVPNTYIAKGGPTLTRIVETVCLDPHTVSKLMELSASVFTRHLQSWGAIAAVALLVYAFRRGRLCGSLLGSLLFCLASASGYLLLPDDWMPELRFATLFYPAFYLLLVSLCAPYGNPARVLLIIFILFSAITGYQRLCRFAQSPTISFDEVATRSDQFARWAGLLSVKRPSIMTADAGGFLIRNDLELVDLGMLCDRQIARCLGEGSSSIDLISFHNYVFDERKPTFISTRAYHGWIAKLDSDARFRRDYMPVREYIDTWILKRFGEEVFAGDFVRREFAESKPEALKMMRLEAMTLPYPFCGKPINM